LHLELLKSDLWPMSGSPGSRISSQMGWNHGARAEQAEREKGLSISFLQAWASF
jgi:hypothetical protein